MLEKSCRWWPIWYLLFFCHGSEGQLQWVVKEKVTAYGQNLILFCPVDSCCSELAGWFVGNKTIIIDVKTFSNDPKVKYHGTYNKDGFGVVIRNLSKADLNVTYHCIYGFDRSTPKYLLHGDVFRENVPDKDKEIDTAAIYKIAVPIVLVVILVAFIIGMACEYRSRIKKKRQKQTGIGEEIAFLEKGTVEEKEMLCPVKNQQGTDEEKEDLCNSDIEMKNQQDNPFSVHTFNQDRTNYARLGLVVVKIFPNILREIVCRNMSPKTMHQHIIKQIKQKKSVFNNMTCVELESLNTLTNGTYDNIDFTTLYHVTRSLYLLDVPTQGWGKPPTNEDVTISDDVERLRFIRNKIVHRLKADIDLNEMNKYFSNIVHITQRIDTYLCKRPHQGFATEVHNFQTHCMDPELEKKYYQDLKDIEDITEKYSKENVKFYYGKTFSNLIQDAKKKSESSVIPIILVLEDINDDEKQRILNKLKTEINSGQVNIKFKLSVAV